MKIFNSVQGSRVAKSKFNLSHEKKISMGMNDLVPILVQEIVPGDSFRVNTELMARLQPLVAPMYQRLKMKVETFFVPNRLVYDGWQDFITGGEDGASTEIAPYISIDDTWNTPLYQALVQEGALADYMGLPSINTTTVAGTIKINALPFRAYQLIYNEYYRDQNLQDKIIIAKTGGTDPSPVEMMTTRQRAWEKDYFTSALPFAQKGEPVNIPSDINYKMPATAVRDPASGSTVGAGPIETDASGNIQVIATPSTGAGTIENIEDIGITVNDFRTANRVQMFLEKLARAGSRYIEVILSMFNVLGSDARLQRPEFLGGGVTPIVVSEVLSTFQAGDDSGYPQGTMSGHGIAVGNQQGFKRKFEEHGFVIMLLSVIPSTGYQQGIPKMFSRFDKYDYLWPLFANLGEQEIKNQELYLDPTDATYNEGTFGYQSRYAEYKYQPSTVHGAFRSSLAFWHMGRIFSAPPVLNESFIKADASKRVFAVEDENEQEILINLYHNISALRPLPYDGTPHL